MCSRKKKKEAEARAKMEQQMRMMQMQRMAQNPYAGLQYGPMSNGVNPAAAPSRFIQLTPIVQPIAMVPYSTQNQPLLMYDNRQGAGSMGDDFGFDDDDDDFDF